MDHLAVGPVQLAPVTSARDLGVYLNTDMTMRTHVTWLVRSCIGCCESDKECQSTLCQICSIQYYTMNTIDAGA